MARSGNFGTWSWMLDKYKEETNAQVSILLNEFFFVTDGRAKKARVFVPDKFFFLASLAFDSKVETIDLIILLKVRVP
jgi:hypothetical protein